MFDVFKKKKSGQAIIQEELDRINKSKENLKLAMELNKEAQANIEQAIKAQEDRHFAMLDEMQGEKSKLQGLNKVAEQLLKRHEL